MTDLELTEVVAKFCGLKKGAELGYSHAEGELWFREDGTMMLYFNPLTNKNDLWDIVVPRLLPYYDINLYYDPKEKQNRYSIDNDKGTVKSGLYADLPRTTCGLVAELAKEGKE